MAGIDKMKWTLEQKYKFYEWFYNHYKVNQIGIEIMESIAEYDCIETDGISAVTNFSNEVDMYLKEYCKLDFVQKRLKEQYSKFKPPTK